MDVTVIVIVAYLGLITLVGSLLARKTSGSRDWAVAGGGMSTIMIAVGVAGTRIGGAGTYGVAGNVMTGGVWNMWWYGITTFLAMAMVGFFFAVPYRRLRLQTVGEAFTMRFKTRRNQVLTSLCVQTEYFIVNIVEAYVIAVILRGLFGLDMVFGVWIAAFILITYIAFGGLWGAAVTNLVHCIVIVVGLLAVGLMGINDAGGWASVTEQVNTQLAGADRDSGAWWAIAGAGWGAVLGMFFSVSVHTPAASIYTNYSTAARAEKDLLPGFLLAGAIAALMPVLAGLIGILTIAKYGVSPGTAGYTNLTKLAMDINPVVGGLALAAVLAAVISSGGPILLSSATMFVRDWLPFTRSYSSEKKLLAYRITTLGYGLIAALFAWIVSLQPNVSVLDMILFGFAMVVPPAVAIGDILYWKRTTDAGAFWGMMTGYAGGLIWFALIKWALAVEFAAPEGSSALQRLFYYCFTHNGEGIDPSYPTMFIPFIVVPLVSLFTEETQEGRGDFYAIVPGEKESEPEPLEA